MIFVYFFHCTATYFASVPSKRKRAVGREMGCFFLPKCLGLNAVCFNVAGKRSLVRTPATSKVTERTQAVKLQDSSKLENTG